MTDATAPQRRRKRHKPDSGDKFKQHRDIEAWFPHLPARALKVWWIMWNIQPTAGEAFYVSHTTLGERVRIDRANAVRMVALLKRLGLLQQLSTGNSGGHANTYRIPAPIPRPPEVVHGNAVVSPATLDG